MIEIILSFIDGIFNFIAMILDLHIPLLGEGEHYLTYRHVIIIFYILLLSLFLIKMWIHRNIKGGK